jgi:hypothetical protein
VPAITGDSAIDVAIGLAFLYFLLSIVCSSVNEAIAAATNLRAATLEAGIRELLEDPSKANAFFAHWRIQMLHSRTILAWFGHKKAPSYIPPSSFALTLLDTFAPPTAPPTPPSTDPPAAPPDGGDPPPVATSSYDLITRAETFLGTLERDTTGQFTTHSKVAGILQDALDKLEGVGADREKFLEEIESGFNKAMDRVSGWYKRRSQLFLFVIALAFAGGLNVDSYSVGQRLWKDDALRSAIVAQTSTTVHAGTAACTKFSHNPVDSAARCVSQVKTLNLPLGWNKDNTPKEAWSWDTAAKAIGILVTAFAVMLGAPFWFDFLGKASNLRSAGSKPAGRTPAGAETSGTA